jgi:hypothetical protein
MQTCDETVLSINGSEYRIQTALSFSFSGKISDWSLTFATQMLFRSVLRTKNTPPIILIGLQAIFMTGHKQRYSLSRMLKDFEV